MNRIGKQFLSIPEHEREDRGKLHDLVWIARIFIFSTKQNIFEFFRKLKKIFKVIDKTNKSV